MSHPLPRTVSCKKVLDFSPSLNVAEERIAAWLPFGKDWQYAYEPGSNKNQPRLLLMIFVQCCHLWVLQIPSTSRKSFQYFWPKLKVFQSRTTFCNGITARQSTISVFSTQEGPVNTTFISRSWKSFLTFAKLLQSKANTRATGLYRILSYGSVQKKCIDCGTAYFVLLNTFWWSHGYCLCRLTLVKE